MSKKIDCYEWDKLEDNLKKNYPGISDELIMEKIGERPFGPIKEGSNLCRCGSIASGGRRAYCTCDTCF